MTTDVLPLPSCHHPLQILILLCRVHTKPGAGFCTQQPVNVITPFHLLSLPTFWRLLSFPNLLRGSSVILTRTHTHTLPYKKKLFNATLHFICLHYLRSGSLWPFPLPSFSSSSSSSSALSTSSLLSDKQASAVGILFLPGESDSAHFSPAEERWDVSHRHIAGQSFDPQVAVICEEHHLSLEPHCPICFWSREAKKKKLED